MNFPEKLQKLRKERGWSQEELANRITVSRQAVSKWELGTAVPDTDNIVQLSELFGVTTDYLIKAGLDSDYFTQPGKLWRLMSAEDQRATCENTARAMGDSALFIKQRHVRNCSYADPEYGKGVAKALGIDYEEALKAEDPAHPTWDPRNKK